MENKNLFIGNESENEYQSSDLENAEQEEDSEIFYEYQKQL